jgi:WXXGXW repeat (2 copies)
MKEEKININGSWCKLSEGSSLSTESSPGEVTANSVRVANRGPQILKGRGKWTRRAMVTSLLGSLLLVLAMLTAPAKSSAQVSIFVSFGPPAIPVYAQPYCPGPGYIWTPGYWAWDPDYGYYWVPGTWLPAPFVGAMWTPGYWGWYNSGYMWYPGYWGTAVGFYGGIDYGYGYNGRGYYGGYWRGGSFFYNREVNRIGNGNFRNVYSQRVVENNGPRISFNGGRGGINARPTSFELSAQRSRRFGATNQQLQQERFARSDPAQRARENHGRPGIAATARPGEFRGSGVVRATRAGAPYNAPSREMRGAPERGRSSPAPVERRTQSNAPRQAAPNQRMDRPAARQAPPNQRMERSAPAQQRNEPQVNRNNQRNTVQPNQRMERSAPPQQRNAPQVNRNNQRNTVQRNQRESRPAEARRSEGRGEQQRQAHPPNQGKQEGGKDHNPGHERG